MAAVVQWPSTRDCDSRNTGSNPVGRLYRVRRDGPWRGHHVRRSARAAARAARAGGSAATSRASRRCCSRSTTAGPRRVTRCWPRARRSARSRRRRSATSRSCATPTCPSRGGDGFTPLHLAAFFGGADAVRAILARGADPDADADNPPGVRPIHSAAAVGDHRVRARAARGRRRPERRAAERPHAAGRRAPQRRTSRLAELLRAPRRGQPVKWTLPLERARDCARSMKSSRLIAARHRRATSFIRAVSERRSSSPCLASSPNSTVAAIS